MYLSFIMIAKCRTLSALHSSIQINDVLPLTTDLHLTGSIVALALTIDLLSHDTLRLVATAMLMHLAS